MIGRLWLNECQICHWRASSLLFMPNGCHVLALLIRWASRAFLTESRLLIMSSIGMRRTSLIEWLAWLKWSDTGVVVVSCWWFRIERRCYPKRSLSWRLVSPMYWRWHLLHSIRYIRFLDWQDVEALGTKLVKQFSPRLLSAKNIPCCTRTRNTHLSDIAFPCYNVYARRPGRGFTEYTVHRQRLLSIMLLLLAVSLFG